MQFSTSVSLPIALVFLKFENECLLLAADQACKTSLGLMKHRMYLFQSCRHLSIIHLTRDHSHLSYFVVLEYGKNFLTTFQKMWNCLLSLFGLWNLEQHTRLSRQRLSHSLLISCAITKVVMAVLWQTLLKTS